MADEIRGLVNTDGTEFVDARELNLFIPSGGTVVISGGLTVSGTFIGGVDITSLQSQTTTISGDLDTLETYTNGISGGLTQLDDRFVNVDGDTMTGNLTISGDVNVTGTIIGSLSGSGRVLVSATDTTPRYIEDKIITGQGLTSATISGGDEKFQVSMSNDYLALSSSGLFTGGTISIGISGGTIDIAHGDGFYIDSATDIHNIESNSVIITAKTNVVLTNIATQPVTYILIDKDDNVVQLSAFPTPTQRRDNIFLGVAVHSDNVTVNAVNNTPGVAIDTTAQIHDLMIGLGLFNLSGNVMGPYLIGGPNLSITKSIGRVFKAGSNFAVNPKAPHEIDLSAQALVTFRYRNQDSSEDANVTLIDPTTYDLNGVTTAIGGSNNQATIQRIYIFPSNIIRIQRGQTIYATLSEAVNAVGRELHITEPNLAENGLLLASLVVIKGTTDLTDDSEALFFPATRFGELGSVGSSSVGNLQDAYNNSIDPEIVTDTTRLALTVKRGSGADTDNVFEVKNGADATTFSVKGDGDVSMEGSLKVSQAIYSSVQNISGNYTTTTTDNNIFCDGNFPLTLHDASTGFDATLSTGQEMMLNNIGTETVNISGTIQGDVNPDLLGGEIFNIISNGTGWYWKS